MTRTGALTGSADGVLDGLDPEQREVATALSGPVCVLAGAGTGKTRAITHRIAYGVLSGSYQPHSVLAVTFTTRAAGEMRGRLRELGVAGVQARTFHSAALRQARFFWPQVVGADLPPIVERKLALLAEAAARCRVGVDAGLLRDLAGEVEWAKVTNVGPDGYPAGAAAGGRDVAGLDPAMIARVYAAYEEVKTDRGRIDLEDVLLCAVGVLDSHPGVAEQVRAQYRHLVVDEYQDVSPLQQRLLDLWLGGRAELCVVGDVSQTIYSFAGARPDYLVRFAERYPGATVVRLVRDYRSTPQVVAVANALLDRAGGPAARTRVELVAQRPPGPAAEFCEHADEEAEAAAVARAVRRLLAAGVPAREVAVLFRINAMSQAHEQALAEAGVPFLVRGGERFFDRPEVRQAGVLLRGAVRAGGPGAGAGALREEVRAVLAGAGWSPEPPSGSGSVRERWESLAALVALTDELAGQRPGAALADLVTELESRAVAQHAPMVDGVTLATFHAAKGLEWDAVFCVGVHEGTVPISYAGTPDQVEEERRLLYVGVTRARRHLWVSWSRARAPGGRGARRPSRFLDGVRPSSGAAAAGAPRARRRGARAAARCRACGRPLHDAVERKLGRCRGCPSTMDEALFERLREWRRRRAADAQVPAYVVFTDATITAIAEAQPTAERGLAGLPGVGAVKLERYGAEVLAICRGEDVSGAADGPPAH